MDAEEQLPYEAEGKLYVPGLKEPLERDGIRSIYIEVSGLSITRHFENNKGKTAPRIYGRGQAHLENCTIGIAGEKKTTRSLSFTCHDCPPDQPDYEWEIIFGFIPADWEIGNDDEWYVECRIPEPVFDEMVKAYKEGSATGLKIRCRSNMWAGSFVRWAPVAEEIDWKLPREKYGVGIGRSKIGSFSWEILSKRALPKEDEPAYKAGQALAQDMFRQSEPPPLDKPKDNYKWLWIAGAALAGFWLLSKLH